MPSTIDTVAGFGLQAIASSLIPQNAAETIRIASAANRMPAARAKPKAFGFCEVQDAGGCCYTAGPLSVVCIDGVVQMGESPLAWLFGGCSSSAIACSLREAADDPKTQAILIDVNSPGGDVAGMVDLVAALRYAVSKKPVHAVARDHACSAAYWAIALATEIVVLPTSIVGSIGVMLAPLIDSTQALTSEGIASFVATTGELKTKGMPGVVTTPAMKAELQRIVDSCGAAFFDAVAEGREIPAERVKLLQGSTYGAGDAVAMGLADRVVPSFEMFIAELHSKYATVPAAGPGARASARSPQPAAKGTLAMATDWSAVTDDDLQKMPPEMVSKLKGMFPDKTKCEEPATAATNLELKAAGFDDEFRLKALDEGLTLAKAHAEYAKHLKAQLDATNKTVDELKAKAAGKATVAASVQAAAGTTAGTAPVSTSGESTDADPFEAAIRAEMGTANVNRAMAIGTIIRKRPDLHAAWMRRQAALQTK